MEVVKMLHIILLLVFCNSLGLLQVNSITDSGDAAALKSLKNQWQNTPPSWDLNDPCGQWDGVNCTNSRVTSLTLSSMNIGGTLSGDIGVLSELISLDLSYNRNLNGTLTARLGDLKKLKILILAGCGFTGSIPKELGNLANISYFALNSNMFSGSIPPTLGRLSEVYWLDISDNQLTGSIPVSTNTDPGLDLLLKAKHFHFNKNKLSGTIPSKLFSSGMVLIHILFDGNQFTGSIPDTIGLIRTLEAVRLDRNLLSGSIPSNINNLTSLNELHLANNNLVGAVPDLTGMNSLNYVDLSNNSFTLSSDAPKWFTTIQTLNTLAIQRGSLQGTVPQKLFSLPQLQTVNLKDNRFNGTLDMGTGISQQLQLVNLQNNSIGTVNLGSGYSNQLILVGNPVCDGTLANTNFCKDQQTNKKPYSTSLEQCGTKSCPSDQKLSPVCTCAYPYEGTIFFRAPFFSDISNATLFRSLETSMPNSLGLPFGSIYLDNPFFNMDNYLQIHLSIFPSGNNKYFTRLEITLIGNSLSKNTFKPPPLFGPYYFIASQIPYVFAGVPGHGMKKGVIIGISIGSAILILVLVAVAVYAIRQKKRAEKAVLMSKPFASWVPSGTDSGGAPQLKGARWFPFDDLKKCTNNFSDNNELGVGGYGKVYKGILQDGQVVAIKRAQRGSMQGANEFKTEIELLSRVHHKNLVALVGFCFEQGEQMLVYEFMPKGTLREALTGRSGIFLDWKKRLQVALGSASGLAYLHELADPPIIHRDIKSANILLDEKLTAKVADFGLSKLVDDTEKGHVSTQVKGTLAYMDPEYFMTNQLTEKSDTYSFGVVMLELITARQPIEKGKYIVREVKLLMDENDEYYGIMELMDPNIRNVGNLIGFRRFLELSMKCVEELAVNRPTMKDMVKEFEAILQNDGLNTNSTSPSTSGTDFGNASGVSVHPYKNMSRKEITFNSDFFNSSDSYGFSSTKVEHK